MTQNILPAQQREKVASPRDEGKLKVETFKRNNSQEKQKYKPGKAAQKKNANSLVMSVDHQLDAPERYTTKC